MRNTAVRLSIIIGCLWLVIGLGLASSWASLAAAVVTNDWFTAANLQWQLRSSSTQFPDYDPHWQACQPTTVEVNGSSHTSCFIQTAFGLLSGDGIIRLNGSSVFRQISRPANLEFVPQPDSDTVLMVPSLEPISTTVSLQYYEQFASQLAVAPDGVGLTMTTEPSSLALATSGYPHRAGLQLRSSLRHNTILLSYDNGQIAWADLKTKTTGVIATGWAVYSNYIIPPMALSPNGEVGLIAYPNDYYYSHGYGIELASIAQCADIPERPQPCQQRDITSLVTQSIPNFMSLFQVGFVSDNVIELGVVVSENGEGVYKTYDLSVQPLTDSTSYLALGDSFASGEGAYNYRAGTDVAGNTCHSSANAYPYWLQTTARSVACSGAKIADVTGLANGQKTSHSASEYSADELSHLLQAAVPGSLNQLDFVQYYQAPTVSISIGGNDIGFADILKACIDVRQNWSTYNTCYPTYEDRVELLTAIRGQYDNLVAAYGKILQHTTGRLYVIGYPSIISPTGSCSWNVLLNDNERQFAAQLTDYLNSVVQAAADTAGAVYVDVTTALNGYRLCETGLPAVNGITPGDDFLAIFGQNQLGQESFHPNALGHRLLAAAIKQQTADFQQTASAGRHQPAAINPTWPILQVPKQNRLLNTLYYNSELIQDVLHKASQASVWQLGSPEIFAPSSTVRLVFYSEAIEIGSYQTDATGSLQLNFTVPASLPPGYHSVHLYGENAFHEPVDVTKTVYVAESDLVESPPGAAGGRLSLQVGTLSARQ